MQPLQLPLVFDEGVLGSADFTVSNDLPVTQAKLTIFEKGNFLTATPIIIVCVIVANQIRVRVPGLTTDALGAGRHMYQLDALNGTENIRIARGELVIVPGVRSVFT